MECREKIEEIITSELNSLGYDIVKFDFSSRGKKKLLRVYIDKSPGGVTIDDCVEVTKSLGFVLEGEGLFSGPYNLEISSPGINRPLTKKEHFKRFRGKKVKVSVIGDDGRKRGHVGIIDDVGEDGLIILSGAGRTRVAYGNIEEANLYGEKYTIPGKNRKNGR